MIFLKVLAVLTDLIIVNVSFFISSIFLMGIKGGLTYFNYNTATLLSLNTVYIAFFYFNTLYDFPKNFRTFKEFIRIAISVFATMVTLTFFSFFIEILKPTREVFVLQAFFVFGGILLSRDLLTSVFLKGYFQKQSIIIGSGKSAERIYELINNNTQSNINVIGIISDGPILKSLKKAEDLPLLGHITWKKEKVPVLGNTLYVHNVVKKYRPNLLILAMDHKTPKQFETDLLKSRLLGVDIITMQTLFEKIKQEVPFKYIDTRWLIDTCIHQETFATIRFKRTFDVILSSILFLLSLPILLIAITIIKASSPKQPAFYLQERLGKYGQPFKIIKLRTMVHDAESDTGPVWVEKNDSRITRIGKFLRKLRIDEIPQLFNVLNGEMSLVGPRPEREIFIKDFLEKIPYYYLRLSVRPGLTGLAQIKFPYAASFEETEDKFRADLYYIKNMSIQLDLAILFKTIRIVLTGKGQ